MGKKFCLFCANYLPNVGGVERYVYNLSRVLAKNGHEVTIVTSNVFNLPTYELLSKNIEIYRMPCHNVMNGRYPVLKKNAEFHRLNKLLREKKFDLAVINARFYIHSIYAAKFSKSNNIPCITIEHGSTHLSVDNKIFDFFGNVYEHLITSVLKRYCSDFYAVSKAAGEWLKHFGIDSKGELYNSIDLDNISKLMEEPICDYREKLSIPANATVITFTGRMLKIKGVDELLSAFKRMDRTNVYLIYAGDGPELDNLKSQSVGNVILLGKIDFEHIITLLKISDVYCLPSVSEGMSTSVMEAIATRTFVITTYNGGAREIITSDEYGIIIGNNSADEVLQALNRAMDREYRESATQKALQRLQDGFTWQKTAEALEKVSESVKNI